MWNQFVITSYQFDNWSSILMVFQLIVESNVTHGENEYTYRGSFREKQEKLKCSSIILLTE